MNSDLLPDSVCILRMSAIGDVTHVVPVVRAIQDRSGDTRITWVCGRLEHKVLAELQGVRFVIFDKGAGWRAFRDLQRELAGEQFDVLLHMQVAARANLASTLIKAGVRLGWDKARSRDLHQLFINRRVEDAARQHQVQGFLSFARALGLDAGEPRWDLPVSRESRAFAEQVLPGEQPTLVISPCSSHTFRNWAAERYAAVADHAAAGLGMRVALAGGPSETEASMGQAIERSMRTESVNLIGRDTLPQSLALLQRADVVLAPDAGPAHLANALGTPVIGLYACTWSIRSGPYDSLDICVDRFPEAARRFTGKEPESLRWGTRIEKPGVMELISVDDVIDRLEEVVRGPRQE
ncbi:MAG: glycosyltransferase family 9 protein [Woeseia sp.]